jgi:hypothetical protein
MKCTCPRCGRGTSIDDDIGDFPVRCHHCSSLVRRRHRSHPGQARRAKGTAKVVADRSAGFEPDNTLAMPSPALERGMLARLLIDGPPRAEESARRSVVARHIRPSLPRGFLQRAVSESRRGALAALSWAGLLTAVMVGTIWLLMIHGG